MIKQKKGDLKEISRIHLLESSDILKKVAEICIDQINAAAVEIATTFGKKGKLLLCGNGGSAADCQHMATEFVSILSKDFLRPGLPAIALTTDNSFITAFTNDFGYENVFSRQVEVLGDKGDILLGISTSGTSVNVLKALETARDKKMRTIFLTSTINPTEEKGDIVIAIPSHNTQLIQEAHLAIEHTICELVEQIMFKNMD